MVFHKLEVISSMTPLQKVCCAGLVIDHPVHAAPHGGGKSCRHQLIVTWSIVSLIKRNIRIEKGNRQDFNNCMGFQ